VVSSRATAILVALAGLASVIGCGRADTASAAGLDPFRDPGAWQVLPSDGVTARIFRPDDGPGLAVQSTFTGGGYVIVRQDVPLELDGNYEFSFRVRGPAPTNHLEFKLVDPSGDNVWWSVRRDFEFGAEWRRVRIKRRHVQFAWGPAGGGEMKRVGAIEIAITAGTGGTGTVVLDDLRYRPLPVGPAVPVDPVATASSSREGTLPAAVLDDDETKAWGPAPGDADPALTLDLGPAGREFGALALRWSSSGEPSAYSVDVSDDGATWETIRTVENGNGGLDPLFLPEQETRFLRIRAQDDAPERIALGSVSLLPPALGESREAFFRWIAARAPRGTYPRGLLDEQEYWTVVGQDGGRTNALLGEDGALETGPGAFSIEPFVSLDGHLITWTDGESRASLDGGSLPIPTVTRTTPSLRLDVTALATHAGNVPVVALRYTVTNLASSAVAPTLHLTARPFQVNPPSQSLNLQGGTARIARIEVRGSELVVDGSVALAVQAPAAAAGVATFDGGDIVADHLAGGRVPSATTAEDPFHAASGVLSFPSTIEPGGFASLVAIVPLEATADVDRPMDPDAWFRTMLETERQAWAEKVTRVRLDLPPSADAVRESFESQIAYILVNRAGAAIRPGTRSYARSWIRDGALTSSALLDVGHADAAADFLRWYAPHQYDNGKIPCVVDARGADPVPEHDSNGEFIFLVADVYRHTKDRALAEEMWPRVRSAVDYLVALRAERLGPEWDQPDTRQFRGLLPPSISHEGYSAKPMHSYWDDFFARVGFADAAYLAAELGHGEDAARIDSVRAAFEADLQASVDRVLQVHDIDYVPGCADLGDFDATSTTIALSPTGAADVLPRDALEATFERYATFFRGRRDGEAWEAFTPYEIRNVGAFVRLGRVEDAHAVLDWMLTQQRPAGWRQWPEVVRSDARAAVFLGDLPHTWVGSDYLRSVLDLFVIREGERLAIGPGIPAEWRDSGSTIGVHDVRTDFGTLTWTLAPGADGVLRLEVSGDASPPDGFELAFPWTDEREATALRGTLVTSANGMLTVTSLPATIELR
jgi:hypothetical protein